MGLNTLNEVGNIVFTLLCLLLFATVFTLISEKFIKHLRQHATQKVKTRHLHTRERMRKYWEIDVSKLK